MWCVQKFSLCKSNFCCISFVSCWFNKTLLHSVTFPMSISIFRGNCCLYNWFLHVFLVWLPMLQRHTPTSSPNPNGEYLPSVVMFTTRQSRQLFVAPGHWRSLRTDKHLPTAVAICWVCSGGWRDLRSLWFPPDSCRCMHDPDQKPTTMLDFCFPIAWAHGFHILFIRCR